jgi:hypothetical protein
LWRDEVNSVNVASQTSARAVFENMHRDSFPAAWLTVLYSWRLAGLGETDVALRRLGLLIGAGFLVVLWWTGWQLGVGPPLVSLVLVGMSPTSVIYGSEVRGYGLAALALAWCVGALWTFVQRPTRGHFVLALLATAAAAQTHYLNCALLAAVGTGAALVCARRRDGRTLLALGTIGLAAAASVVVVNFTALTYMLGTTPLEQGDWGLPLLGEHLRACARAGSAVARVAVGTRAPAGRDRHRPRVARASCPGRRRAGDLRRGDRRHRARARHSSPSPGRRPFE